MEDWLMSNKLPR